MSQASSNDRLTLPVGTRDHVQGLLDAAVVLVEYCDYHCLDSGQAYSIVKKIQQSLGDQLCFVFRHFPLTQLYPQAQKAAEAAESAGAQGKFWEMHNTLFEHQHALDDADLVEYAIALNLDIPQFLREMSQHVHAERVQEDIRSGVSSGVRSTPTFFINGIRHDGDWNLERLQAAIIAARDS